MKFRAGDFVRVRYVDPAYSNYVPELENLTGGIFEITWVSGGEVRVRGWNVCPDWLEPVHPWELLVMLKSARSEADSLRDLLREQLPEADTFIAAHGVVKACALASTRYRLLHAQQQREDQALGTLLGTLGRLEAILTPPEAGGELSRCAELQNAAAPAPWQIKEERRSHVTRFYVEDARHEPVAGPLTEADARLIAQAPDILKKYVASLHGRVRLGQEIEEAVTRLQAIVTDLKSSEPRMIQSALYDLIAALRKLQSSPLISPPVSDS